jgi:hypothetical protein
VLYLGGDTARDEHSGSGGVELSRVVALDRRLSVLALIGAVFFLWPLLVYGRPGYIQDSAAYYKGGRAAVTFVLDKIQHRDASSAVAGPQPSNGGKPEVRGARAVSYSLAAYIFGAPRAQMWLLAAVQALAAGFVCAVTLLLFAGNARGLSWRLAVLAVATPVAFVSCLVVPDVFAAIVILVITLFATAYRSLSPGVRMVSALIAAAGIAFHASHLPIGLAMTLTAISWMALEVFRAASVPRGQWALVAAPFVVGATAAVALNFAAFGGASLTGKRYPLTLARSVAEGPGKWYLEKNCGHLKYAVCELYPHGVPGTINGFLWGPDGVKERATPAQMDRIRDEESDVVLAATRAYPLTEARFAATNFARQLVLFSPGVGLEQRIVLDAEQTPVLAPAQYDRTWVRLVHLLTIASVLASLVVLYRRSRYDRAIRPMVALIFAGIIFNDAVCTYFSGVTDRYEARVIWLIPLLALAALAQAEKPGAAAPAVSPA